MFSANYRHENYLKAILFFCESNEKDLLTDECQRETQAIKEISMKDFKTFSFRSDPDM